MERKVKYDYTFKLECIKLVLEQHYSCTYVANKRGLNESNIRKWVGFYRQYGAVGLLARKNQSYSVPFKLKVLKSIDKGLMSLRDVSIKFNIPRSPKCSLKQNAIKYWMLCEVSRLRTHS